MKRFLIGILIFGIGLYCGYNLYKFNPIWKDKIGYKGHEIHHKSVAIEKSPPIDNIIKMVYKAYEISYKRGYISGYIQSLADCNSNQQTYLYSAIEAKAKKEGAFFINLFTKGKV